MVEPAHGGARFYESVLRELKALQKEGIVKWVGKHKKDPRAYWRLQIE